MQSMETMTTTEQDTYPVYIGDTVIGWAVCSSDGLWRTQMDGSLTLSGKTYGSPDHAASALTLAALRSMVREAQTYCPEVMEDRDGEAFFSPVQHINRRRKINKR